MKRKHKHILFGILSLLVLSFIFGNSLQGGEASNTRSEGVAELLQPILDPHSRIPIERFHIFIRKLAHFTEFSVLGLCLTGAALNTLWTRKKQRRMSLYGGLLAAIADETIQQFTGRTCALKDVAIDFGGVLFGAALAVCMVRIWKCICNS